MSKSPKGDTEIFDWWRTAPKTRFNCGQFSFPQTLPFYARFANKWSVMFGISRKELGTEEILQNQMAFYPHADQQFTQIKASLDAISSKVGVLERKIDYILGVVNVTNETLIATKKLQEELSQKLERTINILTAEVAEVEVEGVTAALARDRTRPQLPNEKEGIKKHSARTLSVVESQLKVTDSINKLTRRLSDVVQLDKINTKTRPKETEEGIEI